MKIFLPSSEPLGDDLVHRHGRLQRRLRRAAVSAPAHHQSRALPGGAGPQRRPEAGRALGGGGRGLDARGRRPRQTIVRGGVARFLKSCDRLSGEREEVLVHSGLQLAHIFMWILWIAIGG